MKLYHHLSGLTVSCGFATLLLATLCLINGCENNFSSARYDNNDELQIADFIDNEANLSIFREMMDYTKKRNLLKTAGTYTLFAPNNESFTNLFQRLGISSIQDKPAEFWLNYFNYHLLDEKINTNVFEPGPLPAPTMLFKKYITADIRDSYTAIKLNNVVTIIQRDIEMSNGYVNITSGVLDPPVETLYNLLAASGNYNVMLDLFDKYGFANYLKDSTITLLVESDASLARNQFDPDSIKNMINWLEYHIVPDSGYFLNQLVKNRMYSLYTEESHSFSVDAFGQYYVNGEFKFDHTLQLGSDKVALNGIYHTLDTVLSIVEAMPSTIRMNLYPPGSKYGAQNVFTQAPARIVLNTGTQSYHQNREMCIMAFDAQQVGDFFYLTFPNVPAGDYRIRIIHRHATSRAKFLVLYNDQIIGDEINLSVSGGVFEEWNYLAFNYCGDITVETRSDVTLYFAMTAFAAGRVGSYCCDVLMDMMELIPINN